MRVLIVSDTHGHYEPIEDILAAEGPFDMMIHCGDVDGQEEEIYRSTGPECACIIVPGNNDYFCSLPRERTITIDGLNVWVTHGHRYYVNMDTSIIKDEAASRGVDIVMFGHTHKPLIDESGPVIAINPGSLTYPRQMGHRPTYIIMETGPDRRPTFELCSM